MPKPPTSDERRHMARVAALGCCVCRQIGVISPATVHHIRNGQGMGQRASHYDTIPLCPLHHQHGGYGVAIHAGRRKWEETFGTERELLEQTRALLEGS